MRGAVRRSSGGCTWAHNNASAAPHRSTAPQPSLEYTAEEYETQMERTVKGMNEGCSHEAATSRSSARVGA